MVEEPTYQPFETEYRIRTVLRLGNLTEVIAEQVGVPVIAIEGDEMSLDALSARSLCKVKPVQVNLFSKHSIGDNMPICQSDIGVVLDPPRDGLKEREALKPGLRELSGLCMSPVIWRPGNVMLYFYKAADWISTRQRAWICFLKLHTLRRYQSLLGGPDRSWKEF